MIDLTLYARTLGLTLVVEVAVALVVFGTRGDRGRLAWDVSCVNLVSHPLAFLARVWLGAPFALIEAIVPVVEAGGLCAAGRSLRQAAAISLVGNAATAALSFAIG